MSNNCPSCESLNVNFIGKIPDTDVFAGKYLPKTMSGGALYSCNKCNCFFKFPRVSKEELDALYRSGDDENWSLQPEEKRNDWQIAYSWIENYCENKKVLDVGCFNGGFLTGLEDDTHLYGVEIHRKAADCAIQMGVNILGNDFDILKSEHRLFDVVTSFDVIEHTYNPKNFLKLLVDVTKPNGKIIISTGNTMAVTWRLMGSRYWYCTISEHVSFINLLWCQRVARECGLEIVDLEYFSHVCLVRLKLFQRVMETVLNVVYRFVPRALHLLRKLGLGNKNVKKYPELLEHPPAWMTAKDHFIISFRKKQ